MDSAAAEIARRLSREAETVCRHYLSNGRRQGRYWTIGDIENTPGSSLQPMEDLMGIDAPDRFQVAIRGRAHDFARHDNRSDPSFWTSRFHSSINKRSFANLCTS